MLIGLVVGLLSGAIMGLALGLAVGITWKEEIKNKQQKKRESHIAKPSWLRKDRW